jgi:F1F0 ATPase subunit 2
MDAERMSFPITDGPTLLGVGAHLAAGIMVGTLYFGGLWWNARLFAKGSRATATIMLMIGRFALLGGLLTLASLEGAMPLLMMALGVFIARSVVMRLMREAAS